ncbi:hypothetical protein [Chamaesiphon minutus]|uniref:LmrA/YxaF family transcription factor n=1 Tax=Chamaesiphon minutus TaxID=1173032 RepID=UPI0003100091|nr:hypothetical protein [Chamaesiphon minutus]
MCAEVDRFFDTGKNSCLWAILILERSSDELFGAQIQGAFSQWIAAISSVLSAAGLDETQAKQRCEDAVIAIQGALILSYGLKDVAPFQRVLKQLPAQLCRDL